MGLQRVIGGYRGTQGVTWCFWALQKVARG